MLITGAIFDLDGTLLDSMDMWRDQIDLVFSGLELSDEKFRELESLTVKETTEVLHDKYGLGSSAQKLYEDICARVRQGYEHDICVFPGVREFLDQMASKEIPMVIASSTPPQEIYAALNAHNLSKYFKVAISTEDVKGRDKVFPDVYLEALRNLGVGTPATTWVFEDAPFAAHTAQNAGFCVCGLLHEHDGRREEDLSPYCDLLVHSFRELTFERLQDFEKKKVHDQLTPHDLLSAYPPMNILIVSGSPEPSSAELLHTLTAGADYIIAADKGGEMCKRIGVVPHVYCGDSDSISEPAHKWLLEQGVPHIDLPAEKYDTDLSFALDCANHEAIRRSHRYKLTCTCTSGGREDHFLAVVGLLADFAQNNHNDAVLVQIVEDDYEMRIVCPPKNPSWYFDADTCRNGATVSVLSLVLESRVQEHGMQWSTDELTLKLLSDKGVSNRIAEEGAYVSCLEGCVAVFVVKTP